MSGIEPIPVIVGNHFIIDAERIGCDCIVEVIHFLAKKGMNVSFSGVACKCVMAVLEVRTMILMTAPGIITLARASQTYVTGIR